MPEFSSVEDTLFVPMLGRIYASENYPMVLDDKKALELKDRIPKDVKGKDTQTQYTLMASAVRSTNMDRYIRDFMSRHEDGVIVQLGCGLETTFFRDDNGKNKWYELDLPAVIEYRRELLGESEREELMVADALSEDWIKAIREAHPTAPILVTASGLFYYFERTQVINLFKTLAKYGDIEVVFDAVNSSGMKRMAHYMKQVGHEDANMYFYVDSADELKAEVGAKASFEEPYYAHIEKKGYKFMTSISMKISDKCNMVKMIRLNF